MGERFITAEERPIAGIIGGTVCMGSGLAALICWRPPLIPSLFFIFFILFGLCLWFAAIKSLLGRSAFTFEAIDLVSRDKTYNIIVPHRSKKNQPKFRRGETVKLRGTLIARRELSIRVFSTDLELIKKEMTRHHSISHHSRTHGWTYNTEFKMSFPIFKETFLKARQRYNFYTEIYIPEDAQLSYYSNEESRSWLITIKADIKKWPNFKLVRDIQVVGNT